MKLLIDILVFCSAMFLSTVFVICAKDYIYGIINGEPILNTLYNLLKYSIYGGAALLYNYNAFFRKDILDYMEQNQEQ